MKWLKGKVMTPAGQKALAVSALVIAFIFGHRALAPTDDAWWWTVVYGLTSGFWLGVAIDRIAMFASMVMTGALLDAMESMAKEKESNR